MNIDFMAMKTVVVAIFCAPHGETTFMLILFLPQNNHPQHIYRGSANYFCTFLTISPLLGSE